MKVLFVSEHCCSRVVKEGVALRKAGIDVVFMQNRIANTDFTAMLYPLVYYNGPEDLSDKISSMRDIDIIHVHNEPDWMGHVCKQFRPDLPLVFDAHDLFSVRVNQRTPDEEMAFKMADAFVYPSKGYMEHALDWHSDKNIQGRPNIVVYHAVNSEFIMHGYLARMNALVYQGGLRVDEGDTVEEEHKYHRYRDYRKMFWWLSKQNIPLMVFAANPDALDTYKDLGAFMTMPMAYPFLMKELTRFSWGLAGGPVPHYQWDTAMPHKLFEYIAAGIPVLTFNAKEVAEFVTENDFGIALDSWRDIPDVIGKDERYRKNVLDRRHLFTMENEIDKLIELYMGLL